MTLSEAIVEMKNNRCVRRICSNKIYGYDPSKVEFYWCTIETSEDGKMSTIIKNNSESINFSVDDFFADDWLID